MKEDMTLKWGKRKVVFERWTGIELHWHHDVGPNPITLRQDGTWWIAKHQTMESVGATAQIALGRLYLHMKAYAGNIAEALKAGDQ